MFCGKCGFKCDDDAMFCTNCGAKVGSAQPVGKVGSNRNRKVGIIAVAVIFFGTIAMMIAAAGGIWYKKSAEDVFRCFQKKDDRYNLHQETVLDMEIYINADGMPVAIPTSINVESDVLDEYTSHGTMEIELSFMGESFDEEIEFYTEKAGEDIVNYYMKTEDGWIVEEVGLADARARTQNISQKTELYKEQLVDASFVHNKEEKLYEISIPLKDIARNALESEVLDLMTDTIDMGDILEQLCENTSVIYVFDRDCNILGVCIKDKFFSTFSEIRGVAASVSMNLYMETVCSGHGTIDRRMVEVPDDVKEDAVLSDDMDRNSFSMEPAAEEAAAEEAPAEEEVRAAPAKSSWAAAKEAAPAAD